VHVLDEEQVAHDDGQVVYVVAVPPAEYDPEGTGVHEEEALL